MTGPIKICPYCGNDRVVLVTTFLDGREDRRRSFCAGSLGCHVWWDAESGVVLAREGVAAAVGAVGRGSR